MNRLIIFAAGIFAIVVGVKKISTNSEVVISSIENFGNIEDYKDSDNFKISNGIPGSLWFYEEEKITGNISDVVYPLVSPGYNESFIEKYYLSGSSQQFEDWYYKQPERPKILVLSPHKDISESTLKKIVDTDTIPRTIEGTRIIDIIDIGDTVKESLAEAGITPENTLIIQEGNTVEDSHAFGWFLLVIGIVVTIGSIIAFLAKLSDEEVPSGQKA